MTRSETADISGFQTAGIDLLQMFCCHGGKMEGWWGKKEKDGRGFHTCMLRRQIDFVGKLVSDPALFLAGAIRVHMTPRYLFSKIHHMNLWICKSLDWFSSTIMCFFVSQCNKYTLSSSNINNFSAITLIQWRLYDLPP